jgi:hypothetical protein
MKTCISYTWRSAKLKQQLRQRYGIALRVIDTDLPQQFQLTLILDELSNGLYAH